MVNVIGRIRKGTFIVTYCTESLDLDQQSCLNAEWLLTPTQKLILTDEDIIAYRQIGKHTRIRPVLVIECITDRFIGVGIDRSD